MRYRVGEDPTVAGYGSTDDMLLFTVVLSLVIGVVLVWLGWRGRQMWLVIWNAGLIVCCLAYLGYLGWVAMT